MKARLKDPDLARLFENTFPNTLGESSSPYHWQNAHVSSDTTVRYYNKDENLAFIITGVRTMTRLVPSRLHSDIVIAGYHV